MLSTDPKPTQQPIADLEDVSTGEIEVSRLLAESEERFRLAFERANIGICYLDIAGRITKANEKLCQILGYSREELEGMDVFDLTPAACLDVGTAFIRQASSGAISRSEFVTQYLHRDGHTVWGLVSSSLVQDPDGMPLYFIIHVQDITERKRAEERLRVALQEKEVLLSETYHRTKNNLAIVNGLLYLQSKRVEDWQTAELFRETEHRVQAMILVHEMLYRSKDYAQVALHDYVHNVANALLNEFQGRVEEICLELDLNPVTASPGTAIPCGLILNELLTNALKYAFPDRKGGTIRIRLSEPEPDMIELVLGDNGVGLGDDFDLETATTLGLQLVSSFVNQLQGSVAVRRDNGTEFRIRFKKR